MRWLTTLENKYCQNLGSDTVLGNIFAGPKYNMLK